MPSIISTFEYDIFISYRHKDNKGDHWVTEFVRALKTELEATFKEDISIYFDSNPNDGLLETHNVDKSLEGKLKCLIFIPIISQTYCDTKSFAWQHEFVAFNKLAKEDQFGRDIKLSNGNVASRILPIKIHDIDSEDKAIIESEIGGVLRAIEFIFKSNGVSRPLRTIEDLPQDNLNKTFYRDQVNKVGTSIKDLISAMKRNRYNPAPVVLEERIEVTLASRTIRKRIAIAASILIFLGIAFAWLYYKSGWGGALATLQEKSIAVLPFENMNHDAEQDYFSNGIAEDILNHLTKISDLKVKSRTSTLQYKGTQKSITEIGEELSVANVVEGSVRRVGDKVRIVVQLIDAKTDVHLWSETYDRELKDVLALQSEIAIEIANALEARLTLDEKQNIQKEISQNITAYDYFLKARESYNNFNMDKRNVENAMLLVNQALQLDPNFSKAYGLKGRLWNSLGHFGKNQKTWYDSAMYFSSKAIAIDPSSPDGYLVKANVNRQLGKLEEAKLDFHKAYQVAPNDPEVLNSYGYQLLREGNEQGADLILKSIKDRFALTDPDYYVALSDAYFFTEDRTTEEQLLKKAKGLDPGSIEPYMALAWLYGHSKQIDKQIVELKAAEKINPEYPFLIDQLAWASFNNNDLENAVKYWSKYPEIEARFEDSTQTVPFRARLGMTYLKMGKKKEAEALFREDMKIELDRLSGKRGMGTWVNLGAVYYDLALDYAFLGKSAEAVQSLDSAFHYQFYYTTGYEKDPALQSLKGREDFKKACKKIREFEEFRKRVFSNALNRREASKDLKNTFK